MANVAMDVVRRSASASPAFTPNGGELAKLIDVSKCIGCKACQAACIEWNDLRPTVGVNFGSYQNPEDLSPETFTLMRFDEWENTASGRLEWLIRKDGCMHCAEPGCLKACPSPGAIVQYSNGIVDFDHEKCIGCGYCVKGCPFNIPRVSKTTEKAYKCTLCSDRIAVGQIPACAKSCPTQAITFGTKEDRLKWADKRVADLKSRGYSEAGIYDPPGVGGAHVFYVLPFADKPSRYSGLPDNPRISPIVEIWKGVARYAGLAVLGLAAVGAAVHHAVAGPNRVSRQDEDNAARLKEGAP